jgi:hypothetical protein
MTRPKKLQKFRKSGVSISLAGVFYFYFSALVLGSRIFLPFSLEINPREYNSNTGYESYKYKITKVSHNHKNSHKITIIYKNSQKITKKTTKLL